MSYKSAVESRAQASKTLWIARSCSNALGSHALPPAWIACGPDSRTPPARQVTALAQLDLARRSAWPGYSEAVEWRLSTREIFLTLGAIFTNYHQEGPVLILHNDGWVRNRFKLSFTTPHYGGRLWWLHCAACQKRVRILHVSNFPDFRCRTCLGLAYETQLLHKEDRALRTRAIHRQLGMDSSVHQPLPPRPYGMHRWKYWRLADKEFITGRRLQK